MAVHVGEFMGFPLIVDPELEPGEVRMRTTRGGIRVMTCASGGYIDNIEKLQEAAVNEMFKAEQN